MTWIHREAVGAGRRLRLGIAGPSRSGKTYSSLRVASGMAEALGGKIFVIDTDNEFSLDYAEDFKFTIVDFQPPFTSERYQEAVQYCVEQGAAVIVVDHMTHEHTGDGGMLERQEKIAEDLAKLWKTSRDKATWAAWAQAKAPHQKFVSFVTRVKQPIIFNFRAKDRIKLVKKPDGKQEAVHIGYTPICVEQFDFEMTAMILLPPNSDGMADKTLSEIRKPLRNVMRLDDQLDESLGRRLAAWSSGKLTATSTGTAEETIAYITPDQIAAIETRCQDNGISIDKLKEALKVSALAQIPASMYDRVNQRIDKTIDARSQQAAWP